MDDNTKKEKKKTELKEKNTNTSTSTLSNDIIEPESSTKVRGSRVRNEIAELKKDVKEILRLMNALYDFESQ